MRALLLCSTFLKTIKEMMRPRLNIDIIIASVLHFVLCSWETGKMWTVA